MVKKSLKILKNSPQKSILAIVLGICPVIMAQDAPRTLENQNTQISGSHVTNTPEELFLQESKRCEALFNQLMSLFSNQSIDLKQQLLKSRVTTLYTMARSSAVNFATSGEVMRAVAVLKGVHSKLLEYAEPSKWDRLLGEILLCTRIWLIRGFKL